MKAFAAVARRDGFGPQLQALDLLPQVQLPRSSPALWVHRQMLRYWELGKGTSAAAPGPAAPGAAPGLGFWCEGLGLESTGFQLQGLDLLPRCCSGLAARLLGNGLGYQGAREREVRVQKLSGPQPPGRGRLPQVLPAQDCLQWGAILGFGVGTCSRTCESWLSSPECNG